MESDVLLCFCLYFSHSSQCEGEAPRVVVVDQKKKDSESESKVFILTFPS